jgi:hypothetical protein
VALSAGVAEEAGEGGVGIAVIGGLIGLGGGLGTNGGGGCRIDCGIRGSWRTRRARLSHSSVVGGLYSLSRLTLSKGCGSSGPKTGSLAVGALAEAVVEMRVVLAGMGAFKVEGEWMDPVDGVGG